MDHILDTDEGKIVTYTLGYIQKMEEDGIIETMEGMEGIRFLPAGWIRYAMIQDEIKAGKLNPTVIQFASVLIEGDLIDPEDDLAISCIVAFLMNSVKELRETA